MLEQTAELIEGCDRVSVGVGVDPTGDLALRGCSFYHDVHRSLVEMGRHATTGRADSTVTRRGQAPIRSRSVRPVRAPPADDGSGQRHGAGGNESQPARTSAPIPGPGSPAIITAETRCQSRSGFEPDAIS